MAETFQIIPVLVQICAIILSPLIFFIAVVSYFLKQFIVILAKYLDKNIVKPIASEDVLYLDFKSVDKPHSVIPVVFSLDGCPGRERIVHDLNSIYSRFRKDGERMHWKLSVFPVERMGYWFWAQDDSFNIENHVNFLEDTVISSEHDISSLVSKLGRRRFPSGKPLWDITVVPYETNEKTSTKSLLMFRFSHSLFDGYSFIKLYYRLGGHDRLPKEFPSFRSKDKSLSKWMLEWTCGLLTGIYGLCINTQKLPDCNSLLNLQRHKPSGEWICKTLPKIPLHSMKKIKVGYNCSFDEILLSAVFGGLQNYLKKYGGCCPPSVHCLLPLPKSDHPDDTLVNHFYTMIYEFPLDSLDPQLRTKAVQTAMIRNGTRADAINKFAKLFIQVLNTLPVSSYLENLTNFVGCTVQASLIPVGNQLPNIFGVNVDTVKYWMPISRETAAAFTWACSSVGDSLWITLVADKVWLKNKERLDELAEMIYSELNMMIKEVG